MTEQELAAIEARANAATAGPWHWVDGETDKPFGADEIGPRGSLRTVWEEPAEYAGGTLPEFILDAEDIGRTVDATFIAHARTDIPALVAELKAYRRALLDACGDLAGQAGGTAESWAAKLVAAARADLAD
jgi:hypothetical protein